MSEAVLTARHFQNERAARKYLERCRWPDKVVCPHCGCFERITRLAGLKHRAGLFKCGDCRKQFSVTVGTLFERSKIPLHKWLQAAYRMCASKKSISTHQLHRELGITYKSAWFMAHRIREAMRDPMFTNQLGGSGKVVEIDETFWGNQKRRGRAYGKGYQHKEKIFALVERGGDVRSYHVESVNMKTLLPILRAQVAQDTAIMSDDFGAYRHLHKEFLSHDVVSHTSGEYVRGRVHTQNIENYFSLVKRALVGTFHHVSAKHLRRYIGEFDFRYNNRRVSDEQRTLVALMGIEGKRLMYREPLMAKR
jgi:transposase-like protein